MENVTVGDLLKMAGSYGDDVEKITLQKQTRQRKFNFNTNPDVVETEVKEVAE